MKRKTLLFLMLILFQGVFAQPKKGDWIFDFSIATENIFAPTTTGSRFDDNQSRILLEAGRFFGDQLLLGLRYENDIIDNRLLSPGINANNHINSNRWSAYGRYYFGKHKRTQPLFIFMELFYQNQKTTFQNDLFSGTFSNNSRRQHLFQTNIGIGWSFFAFENASLDLSMYYKFGSWDDDNLRVDPLLSAKRDFNINNGNILLQLNFLKNFGLKGNTLRQSTKKKYLQKKKNLLSGAIQYGLITLEKSNTLDLELSYLRFVSARFGIGVTSNIAYTAFFREDNRFAHESGLQFRYYQSIATGFSVFAHFASTLAGGSSFSLIPGLGINVFLTDNLSLFGLYTYRVQQNFRGFSLKDFEQKRTVARLQTGFAFFF